MTNTILHNKLFHIFMMLFVMSIIVATHGYAQSFSCSRAQIPSEMAICNNENLLLKDEKVGELVGDALATAENAEIAQLIARDHARWLSSRNACTNNFDCLEKKYDQRIKTINEKGLRPNS